MKKHFLLFMALFALGGLNNLFAKNEATDHLSDASFNPTTQTIPETALPFTLSDWNATKFASNVYIPTDDKNLVTWSTSDNSFLFAGADLDTKYSGNDCEQPFIIKLAEAPKKITVKSKRSTTTGENYGGSGWKVWEWDGTKWESKISNGYDDNEKSANLSASTRYVLVAAYAHGGGNRAFDKFEITSAASLSVDKASLAFGNQTAQSVVVSNTSTTAMPTAAWKVATNKFTFSQTAQTGSVDNGQTTFTITPEAGAVAGDNAVLRVTAGSQSVEISVIVYDPNDISLPIDLSKAADKPRFCAMMQNTTTFDGYDVGTGTIMKRGGDNSEKFIYFHFDGIPLQISYTANMSKNGNSTPRLYLWESADGTTWSDVITTDDGNKSKFTGAKNLNFSLKTSTRYIKFRHLHGNCDITNLKITELNHNPSFTMPVTELDWGTVAVGKTISTTEAPALQGKLTAGNLNDAATISTWTASISGGDAAMFTLASANPSNGACNVTFAPTSAGLKTATLTLTATNTTSANEQCVKTVTLKGTGDASAIIEVTDGSSNVLNNVAGLNFSEVVGTSSKDLEFIATGYNLTGGLTYSIVKANAEDADAFAVVTISNHTYVRAKLATAMTASTAMTATLHIQDGGLASLDIPLSVTMLPKKTPVVTWNFEETSENHFTLLERHTYANPFSVSEGASWEFDVEDANGISYADNKLTTSKFTKDNISTSGGMVHIRFTENDTYLDHEDIDKYISLQYNEAAVPFVVNSVATYNALNPVISQINNQDPIMWDVLDGEAGIKWKNMSSNNERSIILTFDGTPGTISFDLDQYELQTRYRQNPKFTIKEDKGTGNCNSDVQKEVTVGWQAKNRHMGPYTLNSATRKVKIYYSGCYEGAIIRNLSVTALADIHADVEKVVLKPGDNKEITCTYSVGLNNITCTIDNTTDFDMSYNSTTGKISLSAKADAVSGHTGVITLTDDNDVSQHVEIPVSVFTNQLPLNMNNESQRVEVMLSGMNNTVYKDKRLTFQGGESNSTRTAVIQFSGAPFKMSFTAYAMQESANSTATNKSGFSVIPQWTIEESKNGSTWTHKSADYIFKHEGDQYKGYTYDNPNDGNAKDSTLSVTYEFENTSTRYVRISFTGVYSLGQIANLKISAMEPLIEADKVALDLKANSSKVYEDKITLSAIKYDNFSVEVVDAANFEICKTQDGTYSNSLTFSGADDGLNDIDFTELPVWVKYKGAIENALNCSTNFVIKNGTEVVNLSTGDLAAGAEIKQIPITISQVNVATFLAAENGTYSYKFGSETAASVSAENISRDLAYEPFDVVLTATPASGYKFFAWYETDGENKTYLSTSNPYNTNISTTKTIGVEFIGTTVPTYAVKGQTGAYTDLAAACTDAASSSSKTVVLASDGILAAGNYTIPAGITLLIPFDDAYTCYTTTPGTEHANVTTKTIYRTLTMADGAHIDVEGAISVSAKRNSGDGGQNNTNTVNAGYGLIDMLGASSITVKDGGNLYVWGYIMGSDFKTNGNKYNSNITVENGGKVYEAFQFTDHHGGNSMLNTYQQAFIINQYYVQSIEIPLTMLSGATEYCFSNFYVQGERSGTLKYMGDGGLFSMTGEGSKVVKFFDPATDRLHYEVDGTVQMGSMTISASVGTLNTDSYIMPLTNNMDITIKSGTTTIQYDASMLPDSKIKVEKDATLKLKNTLYVYDEYEWCYIQGSKGDSAVSYAMSGWATPLTYTAFNTKNNGNIRADMKSRKAGSVHDATLLVNGTLQVDGYLMSTATGGNICSEEEGAQIILAHGGVNQTTGSKSKKSLKQVNGTESGTKSISTVPAMLKNGDGSYVSIADRDANTIFTYDNGKWVVKKVVAAIEVNENKVEIGDQEEDIQEHTYQVESGDQIQATQVTINEGAKIEVNESASLDVAETIIVNAGSTLEVETNAEVTTTTLALSTTPAAMDNLDDGKAGTSSQIKGEGTITAANVYIDITMDPSGTLDGSKYYAFAVPFNVNINGGVQMFKNNAWVACVHNTHYRAYAYNGANRASQGKGSNWVKVANNGTFQPGVFYLVEFADGSANVFRFTKATGELNNAANINLEQYASSNGADAGWNGIANNSLQNASFSSDATVAQVFDPANKTFTTINLNNTTFAIGTPFFIQASAANQTANNSVIATPSAPARMLAQTDDETFGNYTIRIKAEGATKMADQMFISASENASSNYVIGKDLVKMFMGNATVAQLWVNDYGKKLSMNQAVLTNNVADASLTLYAPKAGNYTVYLKDIPEDATISLLENGQAVATLNDGAFTVALAKGENQQYGLRISTVKTIPGVFTSLDEALGNGKVAQKVMIDGVVYIVRDGKLFTVLGQER